MKHFKKNIFSKILLIVLCTASIFVLSCDEEDRDSEFLLETARDGSKENPKCLISFCVLPFPEKKR